MGGQWVGPDPGADRRARRGARRRHLPDPHARARTCCASTGGCAATAGTIPRLGPLSLLDVARALRKLNRLAAADRPRGAVGRRPAPQRSTRPASAPGSSATMRTRTGAAADAGRRADVWGAEPEELSLLHVCLLRALGGQLRAAHRRRGRRPAGPLRRRLAAGRDPRRRGARRPGRARRAGARGSSTGRPASSSTPARPRCAARARDRRDPAAADRRDRVRPAAAAARAPARPADAARAG